MQLLTNKKPFAGIIVTRRNQIKKTVQGQSSHVGLYAKQVIGLIYWKRYTIAGVEKMVFKALVFLWFLKKPKNLERSDFLVF